jgi:putative intracellular protease/amidase
VLLVGFGGGFAVDQAVALDDMQRLAAEAVAIARHLLQADKPVAAICHGPQL